MYCTTKYIMLVYYIINFVAYSAFCFKLCFVIICQVEKNNNRTAKGTCPLHESTLARTILFNNMTGL